MSTLPYSQLAAVPHRLRHVTWFGFVAAWRSSSRSSVSCPRPPARPVLPRLLRDDRSPARGLCTGRARRRAADRLACVAVEPRARNRRRVGRGMERARRAGHRPPEWRVLPRVSLSKSAAWRGRRTAAQAFPAWTAWRLPRAQDRWVQRKAPVHGSRAAADPGGHGHVSPRLPQYRGWESRSPRPGTRSCPADARDGEPDRCRRSACLDASPRQSRIATRFLSSFRRRRRRNDALRWPSAAAGLRIGGRLRPKVEHRPRHRSALSRNPRYLASRLPNRHRHECRDHREGGGIVERIRAPVVEQPPQLCAAASSASWRACFGFCPPIAPRTNESARSLEARGDPTVAEGVDAIPDLDQPEPSADEEQRAGGNERDAEAASTRAARRSHPRPRGAARRRGRWRRGADRRRAARPRPGGTAAPTPVRSRPRLSSVRCVYDERVPVLVDPVLDLGDEGAIFGRSEVGEGLGRRASSTGSRLSACMSGVEAVHDPLVERPEGRLNSGCEDAGPSLGSWPQPTGQSVRTPRNAGSSAATACSTFRLRSNQWAPQAWPTGRTWWATAMAVISLPLRLAEAFRGRPGWLSCPHRS